VIAYPVRGGLLGGAKSVIVEVNAPGPWWPKFQSLARQVQSRFLFVKGLQPLGPSLQVVGWPMPRPFLVDRRQGVVVTTWQGEGLCSYARLELEEYLLLCALQGLTQWRALQLNPLLIEEDLNHHVPPLCLFAVPPTTQEYALLLEEPQICRGCLQFYCCLGAEEEIRVVQQVIDHVTHHLAAT